MSSAFCRWLFIASAILLLVETSPSQASLLSHWKFDETSGLVAVDSGGLTKNNATWQDANSTNLSWGPGLIGNAAILTGETGSSNVFNVGSIEADGATQLTYSVWIKPNLAQLGSGGDLDNKGIFTTGDLVAKRSSNPMNGGQFWGATWKEQSRFRIDATGSYNSDPLYDGTEGEPEWIHLAFTWDGTAGAPEPGDEEVKTYINGLLVNTATRDVAQIVDDGNWQIGRDRTFAGRTFGGAIDDLIVLDQVLTPEQIALVHSAGLTGVDAASALGVPEPASIASLALLASLLGLRYGRRRLPALGATQCLTVFEGFDVHTTPTWRHSRIFFMRYKLHANWWVLTLIVTFPLHASADILNHWRFDEISGTVAADSGGSVANNAIWRDAAATNLSWGPGIIGNAAIMTGELGAANVFDVGGIEADGESQLTYSLWVKPNLIQLGEGGDLDNKGIFTTGTATLDRGFQVASNQFWGATWKSQKTFRIDSTGTQTTADIYDGTETEPEWIHLAFTWDGATDLDGSDSRETNVYVNGALESTHNVAALQFVDDGVWQIGRDRTFSGRTFGGMIDDLVVWNEVLTDTQINAIYTGGLEGQDAIEAVSLPGGDVNGDGDVDDEDFQIIRENFWQPLADRDQGDLIDNNFIDFADYGRWRQAALAAGNGNVSTLEGLQIPEPSSLLLAGIAGLFCFRLQRC
ncbi:LamG domain-containing protein [Aeoliella sp. ICT_H6.2]|uniref:LamG domain-containing protein n=1 Tax=Aeoliella straminimaris TaxID=2954799 RepID=A0A9X2FJM0_9BACT|nr:LamG-like jellyroll fold domain-containing protein [Aeoliella straminimaris]MCO6047461.1 LamG domain-containing protein [Aeoliella straminimaris]